MTTIEEKLELHEAFASKLFPMVETCSCRCVFMVDPPPPSPELLLAFGILLVAAGAFGFVAGRVKRIRSRVKMTPPIIT